jgi:hypothetical protein
MSIKPADIALAESLFAIFMKASAAIKALREDSPEVYAAIGEHHRAALEAAEAEARLP